MEATRLYSVSAAADMLGVSRGWVYGRIQAGELPVVELGSTRAKQRVRADDLQALINSRTYGKTEERAAS